MPALATIFIDFNLPNGTTWFYFSLLVAVALFFKFSRFFSVRNWDVVTLFLLVPGLLLLKEAHEAIKAIDDQVRQGLLDRLSAEALKVPAFRLRWFGYLWLFIGSGYFLVRCLVDLALVRRPALSPNLNLGGLAWLGGALLICLSTVAFRPPSEPVETIGKQSASVDQVKTLLQGQAENLAAGPDVRYYVGCALALVFHLAVVAGLIVVGCRHFQDAHAGVAMAVFYLLLPYTALHIAQWHHVAPVALLVWAVAVYQRPILVGLLLGLAAGTMYFPALVLPVWVSFYWRRGARRFLGAFALAGGLSLAAVGLVLWLQGDLGRAIQSALTFSEWQPWKQPQTESFWRWLNNQGIHWVYRTPVFIAYLVFVLTTLFWPAPKNLAHVIALSAAALIGIQFWYADQGGVYILWYLPLLLLMVFRPNLSDRRPPIIAAEADWLARVSRRVGQFLTGLLKLPEPLVRVR